MVHPVGILAAWRPRRRPRRIVRCKSVQRPVLGEAVYPAVLWSQGHTHPTAPNLAALLAHPWGRPRTADHARLGSLRVRGRVIACLALTSCGWTAVLPACCGCCSQHYSSSTRPVQP